MPNTFNILVYNKLGRFLILCDACFSSREGKSAYDMNIYFDNSRVVTGAPKERYAFLQMK